MDFGAICPQNFCSIAQHADFLARLVVVSFVGSYPQRDCDRVDVVSGLQFTNDDVEWFRTHVRGGDGQNEPNFAVASGAAKHVFQAIQLACSQVVDRRDQIVLKKIWHLLGPSEGFYRHSRLSGPRKLLVLSVTTSAKAAQAISVKT